MDEIVPVPAPERLRLAELVEAESRRLQDQVFLVGRLDQEVLGLAKEQFPDEADMVRWMVAKTPRLDGVSPLTALGSPEGRHAVIVWLEAAADGGYV